MEEKENFIKRLETENEKWNLKHYIREMLREHRFRHDGMSVVSFIEKKIPTYCVKRIAKL